MSRISCCLCAFLCASFALAGADRPLSFEPNKGQSDARVRFTAKSPGYVIDLDATGARFQFHGRAQAGALEMELENANVTPAVAGEQPLPGKTNYFPSSDSRAWITNVPTYSRVHYGQVYPGVDVTYYGTGSRLEYDFLLQPGVSPDKIRMKFGASEKALIDASGDLAVSQDGRSLHFLKPVAYQLARDGKTHVGVDASYRAGKNANGDAVITFALGRYDHGRELIIDPVVTVDALSYAQYLSQYYVSAVAVDSLGNSYVTGTDNIGNAAFYVSEFTPNGTVAYTSNFGTGSIGPLAIAVDGAGNAYVTGYASNSSTTLPTTSSSYQPSAAGGTEAFLLKVAAGGGSVPYCTFLAGGDTQTTVGNGIAVDSGGKVYMAGYTRSASFPITLGAYQTSNTAGTQTGFVSKFDTTKSGSAALVYSTLLGSTTDAGGTILNGIAVDAGGNAYVAAQGPTTYPVTAGAFRYNGYESGNGGAYVTKLNSTGSGLIYSAYLGYGNAYGIAVEGAATNPSAYVTGTVSYADFPVTAGAYQTSYASGFAVKMSGDGTSEVYSTFLSGPSGYSGTAVAAYNSIALPYGCQSSCNAYFSGYTTSTDFPAINAIQSTPANSNATAFVVELNAAGTSALFSSYLGGISTYVEAGNNGSYGSTPAIAVDSSGNMYVAGNTNQASSSSDFPQTSVDAVTNSYSFLARISTSATAGFLVPQPASVNFGSEPVGVSTSLYRGAFSVRLSNFSSTTVSSLSVAVSPAVFSESDNCGGQILPGSYCSLTLNFTPNSPVTRTGTITITSSASNSPAVIAVSGTGYDQAFVQPVSSSVTFGNQAMGTTSAIQTVTVTNYGDVTSPVTTSFSGGTDFASLNNCPPQLAPGASCTVSITFAPTQAGLRTDSLNVYGSGYSSSIALSGTGTVTGATTSLSFSQDSLQFNPQPTNTTSALQYVYVTNSGSYPVTIQSYTASGNFTASNYNCGTGPFQLNPQQSCYVQISFSPTTAGTLSGALTFIDSASGGAQSVALTGVGVQSTQTVEFYPSSSIGFPNTPVGSISGYQIVYVENTGTNTLTVDRVTISGDFTVYSEGCEATTVAGTTSDGTGTTGYCATYVQFTPTATGTRTGTLTFTDNGTGSPHVVNLTGNGIAPSGSIALNPAGLNFNTQTTGVTSAGQLVYYYNTGNTPVTVTSVTSSLSDYTATGGCGLPYTVGAGSNCYIYIYFNPVTAGTRAGTITFATSAGNQTLSVTGTGLAAAQALGFTPTSMNFGTVLSGQNGPYEYIYFRNTGTQAITFSAAPSLSGANTSDFGVYNACGIGSGSTLAANSTCYLEVRFSPTTTSAESATLTFTDSAGTQTIALSGSGASAKPTYTVSDYLISYNTQVQGTTSPLNTYVYFYNNGSAPVTLGNVGVSGSFVIPHGYDTCSAANVAANSSCYVYVEFAPASAGYQTGTLTFTNSGGSALSGAPVVPLAGYGATPTYTAYVNPTTASFPAQQVLGTLAAAQRVTLYNSGNTPITVGTLSGTNLGLAGAAAEFSIYGANSGNDYCSGTTVAANSSCYVNVTFTPNGTGTRTGTIVFPVTYGNSSTASFTANLTGTGVVEVNSAVVNPVVASFIDQVVGATTTYTVSGYLYNGGNQPLTVGTLVNNDFSEFSTAAGAGGSDSCSGVTIAAGGQCAISIKFTPSTTGARAGAITFPVTFADHTTANPQMTLAGTGVAAAKTVSVSPAALQFAEEIQTLTSGYKQLTVTNTGNQAVTIGTDSVSSTQFNISSDGCNGVSLAPKATCNINITFTPGSASSGTQTATLSIGDNATGGPHSVALSGIAIPASQQIVVSQTALAFGNEPAGSPSSAQLVYFTNQSDSSVPVTSYVLGGTNPGDFTLTTSNCGGTFSARSGCYLSVKFSPIAGTSGSMTATITETDSASPGTHVITLSGTAILAGPAAALNPAALTFAIQNVHTTSALQNFSVTNTGTGSLAITGVNSTNAAEFAVASDGCTGATLTANQHCLIGVQFSPSLGGTRTGSITVSDNAASGGTQTLAVTGTGYGIPTTSFAPGSLTFGSQLVNSTSGAQTVKLSNPGTDSLVLGSIAVTGGNAAEFGQTNNCPAALAPAASCVISVTFTPAATGAQFAYITVTDNANNAAGSAQSVPLTGTGVTSTVPMAVSVSPASGTGLTQTSFTAVYSDPNGVSDLTTVHLLFNNTTNSGANACWLEYSPATNSLVLENNAGTAAAGTLTPGAVASISNNQCTVAGAGTSVSVSGNSLSLTVAVTFSGTFTGTQNSYLYAMGGSSGSGWAQEGTWTPSTLTQSAASLSPTAGVGMAQTFTAVYSDPNGASDLTTLHLLFNTSITPGNGCWVQYYPATNSIYLENNAGNGVTAALTPGSSSSISNSQCTISGTGTAVATAGNSLVMTLALSFSGTFSGTQNTYVFAAGHTSSSSNWVQQGTWTPSVFSLTPSSGSGLANAFTAVYSDPYGTGDMTTLHLLFNSAIVPSNGCWVQYSVASNTFYLEKDAGNGLTAGISPGSAGTISNSQCSLAGTGTTVTSSGNDVTITFNLTFLGTFTNMQNVYLYSAGNAVSNGWTQVGTWTP